MNIDSLSLTGCCIKTDAIFCSRRHKYDNWDEEQNNFIPILIKSDVLKINLTIDQKGKYRQCRLTRKWYEFFMWWPKLGVKTEFNFGYWSCNKVWVWLIYMITRSLDHWYIGCCFTQNIGVIVSQNRKVPFT